MINEMAQRQFNSPNADGDFGMFWDEYNSIDHTPPTLPIYTEDAQGRKEDYDKDESEKIQWLSDVGFTDIAKKIRERKQIDYNDDDMKVITSSLTKSQANAVRRRIEYLNEVTKQRNVSLEDFQPAPCPPRKHHDIREIFDKPSKADVPSSPLYYPAKTRTANSCSSDVNCQKHYHGQRYVAVTRHQSAGTITTTTSMPDTSSHDVPRVGYQKKPVAERYSLPPPVAPKPKEFYNGSKPISPSNARQEYDYVKSKRPDNRKAASPPATKEKGLSQQPVELTKHVPSSSLTFMTGEEREKAMNGKLKLHKVRDYKHRDSAPDIKDVAQIIQCQRRWSTDNTTDLDNHNTKSYDDEDGSPVHSTDVLNFDELRLSAIDSKYIDVDNDSFDKITEHDIARARNSDFGELKKTAKVNKSTANRAEKVNKSTANRAEKVNNSTVNGDKNNNGVVHADGLRSHKKRNNPPYIHIPPANKASSIAYTIPSPDDNVTSSREKTNNVSSRKNKTYNVGILSPREKTRNINVPSPRDKSKNTNVSSPKSRGTRNSSSTQSIGKQVKPTTPTTPTTPTSPSTPEIIPYSESPELSNIKSKPDSYVEPSVSESIPYGILPNLRVKKSKREEVKYLNSDVDSMKDRSSCQKYEADVNQNNDYLRSFSDDSKSLSSRESLGSLDDLHTPADEDVAPPPQSGEFDVSGQKRDGDSTGSLSKSPADTSLEGDARLDVGPTTPRELTDNPPVFPTMKKFRPLPNFNLSKDITGMTQIGDLSEADMVNIQRVALIELTALFDAYHIPMNRKKALLKPRYKDNGVFGVPLTTLSQREENKKHKEAKVPRIFKEMLIFLERHGLQEEGVLRVPGGAARIKLLREAIDKNDLNSIKWEERNVKDVAACLKQFLRDLPVPMLSYEYQNTFLSVADLPDRKIQLQALNLLVILLHPIHQETLKALLIFLNKIVENEAINKMGLNNVSMIMAPNLLLPNGNKMVDSDGEQKAETMTEIMRMLLKYRPILWTIPSFMVGQIRCLYDAGGKTKDSKTVLKIISNKQKEGRRELFILGSKGGSSGDEMEEFQESIIRVKAPNLNKQSMAIKITDETTAADIVAKFQWRRQNSQKEKDEIDTSRLRIDRSTKKEGKGVKFFLCEAAGNIGERRLEGVANINSILKVNPNAKWVLKGYEKT